MSDIPIGVACLEWMAEEIDSRLFSHAILTVTWSDPNIQKVKIAGDEFQNGMPQLVVNYKCLGTADVTDPPPDVVIKQKGFDLPELTSPVDILIAGDNLPDNIQKGSCVTSDEKFVISWEFLNVFVNGQVVRGIEAIPTVVTAYYQANTQPPAYT